MISPLLTGLPMRAIDLLNRNRSALAALVVRGVGVMAGFALTFLIARWFGPAANGVYALVTQSAMFLSVVAVGGLDLAVVREFSRSVALGVRPATQSVVGVLVQTSLIALLLGSLILVFEPVVIPWLIGDAYISWAGAILAVLILQRALTRIIAAILRSQLRHISSQAIELLLLPVLTILVLAIQTAGPQSLNAILQAAVLAGAVVISIGVVMTLRDSTSGPKGLEIPPSNLFMTALPMWGIAITQNLSDWYGLVSVNQWAGAAETGIFRVSWQIATVLPIIALSLQSTFAAQIAAAAHGGQRTEMARLSRTATNLSALIFAPVAALVFVFAEPMLEIFGPEFASGAVTLRILIVGQAVIASLGIAGQVLVMAGHARLNLIIGLSTTFMTLLAAPFAASAAGGMGVALVFTGVYILKIALFFFAVRKLEGFNAFTGRVRHTS